jgi:hypothetical protein
MTTTAIIYVVVALALILGANEAAYHLGALLNTDWSNTHGKLAKQRRKREAKAALAQHTRDLERELRVGPYSEDD